MPLARKLTETCLIETYRFEKIIYDRQAVLSGTVSKFLTWPYIQKKIRKG